MQISQTVRIYVLYRMVDAAYIEENAGVKIPEGNFVTLDGRF